MVFEKTTYGGTYEILASNDFQAVPITITGEDVVKAGTPVKNDGTAIMTGEGALGILLYDVNPKGNPNGAVVVDGIIDWAKCQEHVGEKLTSTTAENIAKAIPYLVFRDKIGGADSKTYAGGAAASEAV